MVNRRQIADCADSEPDPSARGMASIGTQDTRAQHDKVGRDGDEQVSSGQTGEQRQADEAQRLSQEPEDIAEPEDLAVVFLRGVGDVLVVLLEDVELPIHALSSRQSKVDNKGDGAGESNNNMEHTFILTRLRLVACLVISSR